MSRRQPPFSPRFAINPDIRSSATAPGRLYSSPEIFEQCRETIFARSWQFVGTTDDVSVPGQAKPLILLEGMLDEPLVLIRDHEDRLRCLSNVCTHRGALLVESAGICRHLRCRYHGRRFDLQGKFLSMPEFEDAENFPSPQDDLPEVALANWGPLLFASLDPAVPFDSWLGDVAERLGWMKLNDLVFDPNRSRDYLVQANWALYCDNYLEGFHIPFVHASLNQALDYGEYETELAEFSNLQLGVAPDGEESFDLPKESPDHGGDRSIAAYYYWLFPNTMLNFYPWGLSVNVVRPLAVDRTKVSFLTYVADPSLLDRGAGSGLDRVEREDEAIVESVQRGVGSRLYRRGRFSPRRETGVHHFHQLLERFLGDEDHRS